MRILGRFYDADAIVDAFAAEKCFADIDLDWLRRVLKSVPSLSARDVRNTLADHGEPLASLVVNWWLLHHKASEEFRDIEPFLDELIADPVCERAYMDLTDLVLRSGLQPPDQLQRSWDGLTQVLDTPPSVKRDMMSVRYRGHIARQYRYLGDLECAAEALSTSSEICLAHGLLDYVQLQMLRATLLYELGDLYSALNISEDRDLHERCDVSGKARLRVHFEAAAAKCRLDLGDLDKAEYWVRHALSRAPEACEPGRGTQILLSDLHRYDAEVLWARGDYERSEASLETAERLGEDIDHDKLLVMARTTRLELIKDDEDVRQTLDHLLKLIETCREYSYFSVRSRIAILAACERLCGVEPEPEHERIGTRAHSPWVIAAALETLARHVDEDHPVASAKLLEASKSLQPILEKSCRERLYADQLIDRSFSDSVPTNVKLVDSGN